VLKALIIGLYIYGEIFPFTDATSDARSLHYRRWMPALQAKVARS
jgi:hypothetical protein